MTFKALLATKNGEKISTNLVNWEQRDLMPGDVTIAVDYSTVNYKDGLALTGRAPILRRSPLIPGIDLSGTVEASTYPGIKAGDKVVANGWGLGQTHHGGYAQKAQLSGDWLVRIPTPLSTMDAMAIGTAGYTAMLAVQALEHGGVTSDRGEILVTGASGGVGSIAIALLSGLGFHVVASTGRLEETDYLRMLGAIDVIDRRTISEPGKPVARERWAGAVDSVGMVALRDLYHAIDACPSSPGWAVVSRNCKKELLICIRRIGEMRDYPLDLIDIDEIAGIEKELYDYVIARKEKISPKTGVWYMCMLKRLLDFAHACGWAGTPEYALYRSWDEVRAALKGRGFPGIIEFAIRQGKTPEELSQDDIENWIKEMLDKKRSLGTIIITERCFRREARKAGLQKRFLRWSLASKNPSEYRLPLEQMTEDLRREIQAILSWKTSKRRVRGRKAKFKIRPNTANRLLEILTQLCGYAAMAWGLKNVKTLRKLFLRKDVMCGFGEWLDGRQAALRAFRE